jgi:hypothetical protein
MSVSLSCLWAPAWQRASHTCSPFCTLEWEAQRTGGNACQQEPTSVPLEWPICPLPTSCMTARLGISSPAPCSPAALVPARIESSQTYPGKLSASVTTNTQRTLISTYEDLQTTTLLLAFSVVLHLMLLLLIDPQLYIPTTRNM